MNKPRGRVEPNPKTQTEDLSLFLLRLSPGVVTLFLTVSGFRGAAPTVAVVTASCTASLTSSTKTAVRRTFAHDRRKSTLVPVLEDSYQKLMAWSWATVQGFCRDIYIFYGEIMQLFWVDIFPPHPFISWGVAQVIEGSFVSTKVWKSYWRPSVTSKKRRSHFSSFKQYRYLWVQMVLTAASCSTLSFTIQGFYPNMQNHSLLQQTEGLE